MIAKISVKNTVTGKQFEFELTQDEARVGRSKELSDLVLPSERVSRRHAVIRKEGDGYVVVDLGSVNGTTVNGSQVAKHKLAPNDVISISDFEMTYQEVSASRTATALRVQMQERQLGSTIIYRSANQIGGLSEELSKSLVLENPGEEALRADIRALSKKAETLNHLYELSRILSSVFSLEDIFQKVKEMILRLTPADRLFVLLSKPGEADLVPFLSGYRNVPKDVDAEAVSLSKTVLDRVLTEKISLLSSDIASDDRFAMARSLVFQKVHSIMCAPLLSKDRILGVIYVDCHDPLKLLNADDLDLLNAMAAATSVAVDNAITHDQLVKEALARATYGRFLPQHVIDDILADPSAIRRGGSSEVVTILFADIRGFTTLSESLPPDTVVEILNTYFGMVTPIIFENHGMLDNYIGDGLMALFGVPRDKADAAADAVNAAITIQHSMGKLNAQLGAAGMPQISVGIGINSGTATVGYIGTEQRTDYTAIGDSVNLAARLESRAKPAQILISRSTHDALNRVFPVIPQAEKITVKGRATPVEVFEVDWQVHTPRSRSTSPLQA